MSSHVLVLELQPCHSLHNKEPGTASATGRPSTKKIKKEARVLGVLPSGRSGAGVGIAEICQKPFLIMKHLADFKDFTSSSNLSELLCPDVTDSSVFPSFKDANLVLGPAIATLNS